MYYNASLKHQVSSFFTKIYDRMFTWLTKDISIQLNVNQPAVCAYDKEIISLSYLFYLLYMYKAYT